MLRPETWELWREALSEARSQLLAGHGEARDTARRIAQSIAEATHDYPSVRPVYRAAVSVQNADDSRMPERVTELITAVVSLEPTASPDSAAILIVDDDAVTRRIVDKAMASTGRRVIHAASGAEARRSLQRDRLALVLLDLVLPDADGRTILMEIRSTPATAAVPVYVLSGQVGSLPRAECLALGADGFIEKPFNPQTMAMELRAVIHQADERRDYALRDPLTGLPNRAALGELYVTLSAQSERSKQPLALGMIDMDELKTINDTLGHPAGDQAINHFSSVLHEQFRASDVLARWGGDEFVAVTPGLSAAKLAEVLERSAAALRAKPLVIDGRPPRTISFSAGVMEARPRESLDEAVAVADRRVYAAKAAGRGLVVHQDLPGAASAPTVLLAEDDAVTAAIVRHKLTQANLKVLHSPDGQHAWDQLKQDRVSLAILDIQMPGIDGLELLRRIRQDPQLARTPVLILTALGNEQDVVRAFDAGANDYVPKPFSPLELLKRVQRLLKR